MLNEAEVKMKREQINAKPGLLRKKTQMRKENK